MTKYVRIIDWSKIIITTVRLCLQLATLPVNGFDYYHNNIFLFSNFKTIYYD